MPAKSRFTRLDAFTKTVDEARVRTTSGGIVTIASLFIVLYLALGEWREYRNIIVHPELIVDKGRGALSTILGLLGRANLRKQVRRWRYI
jgi:endoplasmic reticulum-Golgi intermediate compartment protein 3